MLEIKPIQTKAEQKEICELCKVEFDADCLAYSAKEDGELLGVLQFRIFGEYAVIYNPANVMGTNDYEALAATIKAARAFIYSCGVEEVLIQTDDKELLGALTFKKDCGGGVRV